MKLKPEDADYLDGLLDGLDELSDGAWQCVCEDRIRADPKFKGKDPYDVWMAWVHARAVPAT